MITVFQVQVDRTVTLTMQVVSGGGANSRCAARDDVDPHRYPLGVEFGIEPANSASQIGLNGAARQGSHAAVDLQHLAADKTARGRRQI